MRKLSRSLLAVGALMAFAACGDDVSVVQPPPPAVAVTGAPSAALRVGDQVQLSANQPVSWQSSAASVASVDANGLVTANAAGTASITATSNADATNKASVTIQVSASKGIVSVEVQPQASILAPGQTLQLAANVVADAGVARTVTWASSNQAVATVSPAGVVTAVAPGNATISATSTVDAGVAGSMALTVRAPTAANVSIKSVTTGATNVPVNVNNVVGQIEVTLNVDPGDFVLSKVELMIDGVVCPGCTQTFTAAQSEALRLAAVDQSAQASAQSEIVFSVVTNMFDAATGAPNWMNGNHTVSGKLTTTDGTSGGSANPQLALVFNNANTYVATLTLGGTTATATGTSGAAAGLAFKRGSLTVSVLPVIYNVGQSLAAGSTVTFGSALCDANGTGGRTRSLTAPAAGSSAWTATFPTTTSGANPIGTTVANYEFNPVVCGVALPNGEFPTINAVDNNGNSIFTGAVPANLAAAAIRLDNRAPGAPTFMANPNIRQNGWINGGVTLTNNSGATSNGWVQNGAADAGVGGGVITNSSYLRFIRIGDASAGTVAAANAATAENAITLPAPTASNNSLCAVITARDELGNESALPGNGTNCLAPPVASSTPTGTTHLRFGVDIDAPTIALCSPAGTGCVAAGSLGANAQLNGGAVGGEFTVTVADLGTVGNSGMLSGSAVRGTVQIRNAALTPPSAGSCFIGSFSQGNCNVVSVNAAPPFPLVPTTTVAASATTGYYTYSGFAQDAAGNQSAPVTRVIAYDAAANVPALTTALFNVPLNGGTVVFNANASDNFDLQNVTYTLTYGGSGLPGPIGYPAIALNQFNQAPLVNSNVAAGITINGFIRQMELVTANAPLATGGGFKPSALTGVALDMANNSSGAVVTAIPGASVTNGTLYTAAAAAQLTNSWQITTPAAATNISDGAATTPANPTSVLLTAVACGPTATYNVPFSVVNFYAVSGGNLVQIGTGAFQGTADNGAANGRCHTWTFTWTPGTAFGLGGQQVWAVGVNAAGDALAALPNNNITITNP